MPLDPSPGRLSAKRPSARATAWSIWGLALALELSLCRVSDGPLALLAVLEELCWFALLGAIAVELPRLVRTRFLRPADVSMVLTGAALGGLWLLALRFGLRPHGALAELQPWAAAFAVLCAQAIFFAHHQRLHRLLAPLVALQGLLVALGIWALGCGDVPVVRLVVAVLLAAGLVGLTRHRITRPFVALFGVAIALFPLCGSDPVEPSWSAKGRVPAGPDVVLIVVDTLRADYAAEMRSHRRLARQGIDLGPAQASSPWTLPSMGSVLTGCDVSEHGARRLPGGGYSAIRADVPTLAEQLASAGYDTAALLARNPNLDERFGFARGFALFDFEGQALRPWSLFPLWGNRSFPLLSQLVGRSTDSTPIAGALGRRRFLRKSTGKELLARARWVLGHRRQRPLFLWLHFMDPHVPYLHLADQQLSAAAHARLNTLRHESPEVDPWFADPAHREVVRRAHRAEVARLDDVLIELLDALGPEPSNGRVIVLTADHGEELWEHGGFEHGHSFYQEVTATPLVLTGVSGAAAAVESPAALIDLAPTILRQARIDWPGCGGIDLARDVGPRTILVENLRYPPAEAARHGSSWEDWLAVRDGPLYLHDRGDESRLFDLAADPGERLDLGDKRRDAAEQLRARRPTRARDGAPVELGADEIEALRALGYVD
jgi:arylsulfatase A-like enzyme